MILRPFHREVLEIGLAFGNHRIGESQLIDYACGLAPVAVRAREADHRKSGTERVQAVDELREDVTLGYKVKDGLKPLGCARAGESFALTDGKDAQCVNGTYLPKEERYAVAIGDH